MSLLEKLSEAPGLMRAVSWIRSRSWLRSAYRLLPERFRRRIAITIAEAHMRQLTPGPRWLAEGHESVAAPIRVFGTREAYGEHEGVNIFAYLRGQFGLAESARMYARALLGAGYPVALVDVDINLPHGMDDRSLDAYIGESAPHDVHLIFVNPDFLDRALASIGAARLAGKYIIACWFWELEQVPAEWLPAIAKVDEILVSSTYVEEAFRRVTDKPILCVRLPLSEVGDSGLTRSDFGLPADKFIFLNSFDFNSYVQRKNPFAAIRAFQLAFPPQRDDVRLVLKTSNGYRNPQRLQEVRDVATLDPRILVRDEILDRSHVHALQRCVDAYVSLHRAEGFGLGLAESMLLGKPVVGTAWSGNMDFMDEQNSCLVKYTLVPVEEGHYAHARGQRWAEADVEDAARWMRKLVDEPGFAEALGARAALDIRKTLSPEAAGAAIIQRLRQLMQQSAVHTKH